MLSSSGNPTIYIGGRPKGNYTDISTAYIDETFREMDLDKDEKSRISNKEKDSNYKYKKDKHLLIYDIER
ncbi:hypothetical protein AB8U03_15300 [Clostridium sp. Mt-5]|uniref:Uncharacterized protein n=1 Tax=Clostridium moutaii TaxID=3240932 RepID=A0ABV4BRY2_9CLOT